MTERDPYVVVLFDEYQLADMPNRGANRVDPNDFDAVVGNLWGMGLDVECLADRREVQYGLQYDQRVMQYHEGKYRAWEQRQEQLHGRRGDDHPKYDPPRPNQQWPQPIQAQQGVAVMIDYASSPEMLAANHGIAPRVQNGTLMSATPEVEAIKRQIDLEVVAKLEAAGVFALTGARSITPVPYTPERIYQKPCEPPYRH